MDAEQKKDDSMYTGGEYLKNNPSWHAEDAELKAEHIIEILEKNRINPASIGDVGCGTGGILSCIKKRFPNSRCVGYDISEQAIEIAKQTHGEGGMEFVKIGDSIDNVEKFDCMLAIDVIEHVEDVSSIFSLLKKQGNKSILHIPLDLSVFTVMAPSILERYGKKYGHIHFYLKETAVSTIERHGFQIIDWHYTGLFLKQKPKRFLGYILKMIRKIAYKVNPNLAVRVLGGFAVIVLIEPKE